MSVEARVSEHPLRRYGAVLGVCILAGAFAGGIAGFASGTGDSTGILRPVIVSMAVTVAMGVGIWSCSRWWAGLDEAAQEAHKWAWWWGSTYGLAFGAVILFTTVFAIGDTLPGEPKQLLVTGAGMLAVAQTVGYAIAWAVWWLRRR